MKDDIVQIVALLVLIIVIMSLAPMAGIWSINHLFNTELEYNFGNWLAVFILASLASNTCSRSGKK